MSEHSVLILAGGKGERFWPWSRPEEPKQLLPLAGNRSLLETTLDRVSSIVAPDRTWILTGRILVEPVRRLVGDRARVVAEPIGRNTAPAVSLGALLAREHGADGAMAVLPADHLIPDVDQFQDSFRKALTLADRDPYLVTFGIGPERPETGYGYIERGEAIDPALDAYHVESFREKPNAATAREFLEAGNFFWNSGMFFWRPQVILEAVRKHRPELYAGLEKFEGRLSDDRLDAALDDLFPSLESISVDYAILEHAENVAMIQAGFEWDDLGSWSAWARRQAHDADGNVATGNAVVLESEDCIVVSESQPVAVLGAHNLIVVQKNGATLVCPIDRSEEVRKIVAALSERGKTE